VYAVVEGEIDVSFDDVINGAALKQTVVQLTGYTAQQGVKTGSAVHV
jgi:hypothetical protein